MREKAWRPARGMEGDVSAEPCMQGEGRELAWATRALSQAFECMYVHRDAAQK